MSPQLALRVTIVGGIALVLFGLIFFRLWYLQVLDTSQYARAAGINVRRNVPVQAQRGSFLGLDGQPIVQSVSAPAISISPMELPSQLTLAAISSSETYQSGPKSGAPRRLLNQPAKDLAIYARLAPILGMSNRPRNCTVTVYYTGKVVSYSYKSGTAPLMTPIECAVAKGVAQSQFSNVTIKKGVSPDVRAYIDERQAEFEGVIAGTSSQREYLLGKAGAQLFGYIAPIQAGEVGTANYKTASTADTVGQSGLEAEYDKWLLGSDGYQAVKVNSQGQFEGYGKSYSGQAGDNVKLSIDPALEKVGYNSLAHSIAVNGLTGADAGGFVAMNPQNGQVYGMGSYPSYNPKIFAHGLSEKTWKWLNDPNSNDPLLNRPTEGAGPSGSTFKVITATAALQSGVWGVNTPYDDTGRFCIPGTNPAIASDCPHNSSHEVGGMLNLESAIEMSDDVFFYNLGYHLRIKDPATQPNGGPLQAWMRKFGLGQATGIDLPGGNTATGTVPTPKLFKQLYKQELECQNATGIYAYTDGSKTASKPGSGPGWHRSPKHPGGCGIADTPYWTVGDDVNTAVGQGDVQLSPLQLAIVYGAIENGGTIVTPHLGDEIQSPTGSVLQKIDPAPKRHLKINALNLAAIQQGLYYAAHGGYMGKGATSSDVMGNFGMPVHGKTGTAQYGSTAATNAGGGSDYAWYACYVPASATHKPIVVVVWVEKGGFGDVAAAPVARQILSQWYYGKPGAYVTGTSTSL